MTLARVQVSAVGDLIVVSVDGEVDISNIHDVTKAIVEGARPAARGLILDLSRTRYLDSHGVKLIFELRSGLETRRQSLRIVVPEGSPLRRLFEIFALGDAVPLDPSREAALGAFRPEAS